MFSIDLIPLSALEYPCCLVVNTKPHNHPGEHWVAIYKSEENIGVYFDSYGYPPSNLTEIARVLDSCKDWTFSDVPLQTFYSSVCGQYCIFFITYIVRGFSVPRIAQLLNDCGDSYANDSVRLNYIKKTNTQSALKV